MARPKIPLGRNQISDHCFPDLLVASLWPKKVHYMELAHGWHSHWLQSRQYGGTLLSCHYHGHFPRPVAPMKGDAQSPLTCEQKIFQRTASIGNHKIKSLGSK